MTIPQLHMSAFSQAADHAIREGLRTDLKGKHRHYKAASFRGQIAQITEDTNHEGHHLIGIGKLWTWRREEIPIIAPQTISIPSDIAKSLALQPDYIISFEAQVRFNTGHAQSAGYSIRYEKDGSPYLLGLHYAMRLRRVYPPLPVRVRK